MSRISSMEQGSPPEKLSKVPESVVPSAPIAPIANNNSPQKAVPSAPIANNAASNSPQKATPSAPIANDNSPQKAAPSAPIASNNDPQKAVPSAPIANNNSASNNDPQKAVPSAPIANNNAASNNNPQNVAPNANNNAKKVSTSSSVPSVNTSKVNEGRPFFAYTQGSFWDGPNADYTTLAVLACFPLTGLLGLDHAYMRSPLTAVIKTVLNIFTLGLWYFFDAAQVLSEGDKIRSIGYSMPVFGPTGLGAGIFTKEGEKSSGPGPMRFLLYAAAVLIPLPFGQDFFAAGDIRGGLAKLVTLFMPLLWIFGFAWAIYILFRLFFQTEALITEGVPRFFPWTLIMDDFHCSRGILGPDRECGELEASSKKGLFYSIGQMVRGLPIIGRVVDPIMSATETAAKTAKAVVEKSVQPSIQFATASVGAAKEILSTVPQVVGDVANQAQAFTDPAKLQQLATQRGGGNSKSLTPLIVLLVGGLVSSGFFLAKVRSMVDFDLSKLSRAIKAPKVKGPTDQPYGRSL